MAPSIAGYVVSPLSSSLSVRLSQCHSLTPLPTSVPPQGSNTHNQAPPKISKNYTTKIDVGASHGCAVLRSESGTDHALDCWGLNQNGQTDVPSGAAHNWIEVSAGQAHTCGIRKAAGDVTTTTQCWGLNYWQILSVPTDVTFQSVSAGYGHTCGVIESAGSGGALRCWGLNDNAQSTPPAGTFSQVASGYDYSCGLKTIGGSLLCWGRNNKGQTLGPDVPPEVSYAQLSAGHQHACALRDYSPINNPLLDGSIDCWGLNDESQLNYTSDTSASGGAGHNPSDMRANIATRVNEPGETMNRRWYEIAVGGYHTCALQNMFEMDCWGADYQGQESHPSPYPTPSPTLNPPTSAPTNAPTHTPTVAPTRGPTAPTSAPTSAPTVSPTAPTMAPTMAPTVAPTSGPTTSDFAVSGSPTPFPTPSPTPFDLATPSPTPIGLSTDPPTAPYFNDARGRPAPTATLWLGAVVPLLLLLSRSS